MRIYALQPSDTDDETIQLELVRSLKPHTGPVVTLAVDSTGTLVATGGADGVVKIWDIRAGYTTHTFHGHGGVVSALHFFQVEVTARTMLRTAARREREASLSRGQKKTTARAHWNTD